MNAISINGQELLLTATVGEAIHLSREVSTGELGRAALPEWRLKRARRKTGPLLQGYDRAVLTEARWSETTMCGRQWIAMSGLEYDEVDELAADECSSPTCRQCLNLMDRLFPALKLDDRLGLVVEVIADTVAEHGYAEMWNVPGDHHAALCKQVRSVVKARTGHGTQSLVHESMVVFICEPIHQQHAEKHSRAGPNSGHSGRDRSPLHY